VHLVFNKLFMNSPFVPSHPSVDRILVITNRMDPMNRKDWRK
jgi:hypothetical protein